MEAEVLRAKGKRHSVHNLLSRDQNNACMWTSYHKTNVNNGGLCINLATFYKLEVIFRYNI